MIMEVKTVLRVMQINAGNQFGGVSSMIYHFYQYINHDKIQFDFVAPYKSSFAFYRENIEEMGGRIIELNAAGNFIIRKLTFWKRLISLIRQEKYSVVHINSGSGTFNLQVAWIAWLCGVKKIIVHSHNGGNCNIIGKMLIGFTRVLLEFGPTDYWACSKKAAEYMFSERRIKKQDYRVINNGVDTDKFSFVLADREKYRKELDLQNNLVILHVGRFSEQKNHMFLIDIFDTFIKEYSDAVLLLVGEGELIEKVKKKVKILGLDERVRFMGLRSDIPQLMSASDVFVLPSLYEGLPVVGVEAQVNGLNCVFSDSITKELDLTGENSFVSLNESSERWIQEIEKCVNSKSNRWLSKEKVIEKGYSLQCVVREIEQIYLDKV